MLVRLIWGLIGVSVVAGCQSRGGGINGRASFEQWEIDMPDISWTENKPVVVLFLSEGMCAECINQELSHIRKVEKVKTSKIVIMGAFDNKRKFYAMVGKVDDAQLIFVSYAAYSRSPLALQSHESLPVYFTMDSDYNIRNEFKPDPGREQATLDFLSDNL